MIEINKTEQTGIHPKLTYNDYLDENGIPKPFIEIGGRQVPITYKEEWSYQSEDGAFRYLAFVLDNRILCGKNIGHTNSNHSKKVFGIVRSVCNDFPDQKLILLNDFSALETFPLSSRKVLFKKEKAFRRFFQSYCVILRPDIKIAFEAIKSSAHFEGFNFQIDTSWERALESVWHNGSTSIGEVLSNVGAAHQDTFYDEEGLSKLSKSELIRLLKEERAEKTSLKTQIDQNTQKIYKVISGINLERDFSPQSIVHEESKEGPFSPLFNSLNILQNDVSEMIRELRELNENIEEKVQLRTEEYSNESREIHHIIENIEHFVFAVDKEFRVVLFNTSYKKHLKQSYGVDIQIGKPLFPVEDERKAYWMPIYEKALQGQTVRKRINRQVSTGKKHWIASLSPFKNESGEVVKIVVFIQNVTSLYKAEEQIRESQQLLESINQNIQEGIYRSTPEKGMVYVNNAFVELFGYDSLDEMKETPSSELYVSPERRLELVNLIMEKGFFENEEIQFVKKDGSLFWGLASSMVIVGNDGQTYFDGAIRDVTKIRETEGKLKVQNEALKKLNAELDSFVYSTSHDLRAPLVSLSGLINIARETESMEECEQYFNLMEQSISKMDLFIRDIMDYSRNSRLNINPELIDFSDLIQNVLNDLEYMEETFVINTWINIQQEHPFCSDVRRLQTIFNNLISNAKRYADPNKNESFVEINVQTLPQKVICVIRDNGVGIPKQFQERIFEMFFRASTKSKGSGLGLYLVKETINKLNGTIHLESEAGEGTLFRFEIPTYQLNS